jgi:hypothetical protein
VKPNALFHVAVLPDWPQKEKAGGRMAGRRAHRQQVKESCASILLHGAGQGQRPCIAISPGETLGTATALAQ